MKLKQVFRKIIAITLLVGMTAGLFACNISEEDTGGGLVISEVVTSNGESYLDETYGSPDWIELHNQSDRSIDLLGWGITDNIKNGEKACTLPDVTIPAGGYLVLLATKMNKTDTLAWDGGEPICLGFSLKVTGETLVLINPNLQAVEEVAVPALRKDVSYARKADGTFGYCLEPTPNAENSTPITDNLPDPVEETYEPVTGIEISEVSSRNTLLSCGGCESCDWVELRNTNGTDIVLDGFTLCDTPDDYDDANLSGTIPANGYLLVYCCKDGCTTKDAHVCVRLGISRYGDHLYLYDNHGNEIDSLEIPAIPEKDMTYAKRGDGTFGYCVDSTPNEANHTEILDEPPVTETPEPDDPEKKEEEFVDPTLNARRPSTVRISEVLPKNAYSIADRDGDRSDWVELYNNSDNEISLAGWYLSDNPKNLNKWGFPATAKIPAHSYLLVFLSGKTSENGELHASFSLTAGETFFLYNDRDKTLDWIEIPEISDNISIGLDENNETVFYRHPTPMSPNGHSEKNAEALGFFPSDGVYISEVCAIHDRGSDEKDWIELHNGGTSAVSLDGWYLSDSLKDLRKYRISSLSIEPNGYAVLTTTASDFKRAANDGNFGIDPSGDAIYLTDPSGEVWDMFETGVQRNGMTSGRIENDEHTRRVFFAKATKGAANTAERYPGYASEPTFSVTNLYQTAPFTLTLSSLDPNAKIYYTTNGSEPNTGSTYYTGPITISKNTVIRAYAVSDGLLKSDIVTYHYLFEQPHTLPVVCIAMAPEDFKTVYHVSDHKNIKERKGFVSYYESDGLMGTEFPCDIKAKGRGTLSLRQKSLQLSLRGAYGMGSVNYPFFPGYEFTEFSALNLRQAGQDYAKARLRDAFASRACQGLNVDAANSRFCIVYINGEYYGIYDFNEELNSKYLETHFGVDADSVNTIMRNGSTAMKGTRDVFKADFNAAKKANLSTDSAYEKFIEKVDPDAFMDYVICRQFLIDCDCFNQKYWRTVDYGIRWRPILYDLDLVFDSGPSRNIAYLYFNKDGTPAAHGSITYFYFSVALKTNPGWRQRFVERYVELVCTHFNNERLNALLDQMISELEPEMERHIARWKHPSSVSAWKSEVETLRKKFTQRPQYALEHMRKEFKLSQSDLDALIAKYSQ